MTPTLLPSTLTIPPSRCGDKFSYLTYKADPDPGPALDTAYVTGNPGAAGTEEEIENTRFRIL